MKTKEQIKEQARILFNKHGVLNVTLRQVASELGKSYGNITYHYQNKKKIIMDLYQDMNKEMQNIQPQFLRGGLLMNTLEAPRHTFFISLKYSFFFTDFMEIKRNFNTVAEQLQKDNLSRKSFYLKILKQLQEKLLLRQDLNDEDLNYIMDLSGMVRTYFFISLTSEDLTSQEMENNYLKVVNQLLFPYLSHEGIEQYNSWQQKYKL